MDNFTPITKSQMLDLSSAGFKRRISDDFVDIINAAIAGTDPEMLDSYKDDIFSYQNVLANGRYKIEDYLSAVKYVSYKNMKYNNTDAYRLTFPDRTRRVMEKHRANGLSDDEIIDQKLSSFVHSYNITKLVNEIYKQTQIPPHILNYANFQIGVNVQTELALHGESERVRSDAADSLMARLATPEAMKMEVAIGIDDGGMVAELRKAAAELSKVQQSKITAGEVTSLEVAECDIIEVQEIE